MGSTKLSFNSCWFETIKTKDGDDFLRFNYDNSILFVFFALMTYGKGNSISWNCKHNKSRASTLLQKRSVNKMLCSFLDSVHYVSLKNSWICKHNKESVPRFWKSVNVWKLAFIYINWLIWSIFKKQKVRHLAKYENYAIITLNR